MKDQLSQVQQLFSKQKYKKALLTLKKINKKQPSFESINYTSLCYFHDKQYPLANLYFVKALNLASEGNQKLEVLGNLALTETRLNNLDKAIEYYIKALAINGSVETAKMREDLCTLAAKQQKHQIIVEHAPKLLVLLEYAQTGLYLLLQSHLLMPDNDKNISFYLKKLQGEIASYDSNQAQRFFELVSASNNPVYINSLVEVIEKHFAHENWFKQFKSQQARPIENTKQDIPANRVVGDNDELVSLVEQLLAHCQSTGAYFHPNLRIFENNGALSVKVFEQTDDTQKLISIPYTGLPLISDYHFNLDANDKLLVTPIDKPANPDAIETMTLLQKIYNSSDKIKSWKLQSPFIALHEHPKLLTKLCAAKPANDKVIEYNRLLQQQNINELTIKSFLGSREMPFKQQDLKTYGITIANDAEAGLLSVIDFLNHKAKSNQYQRKSGNLQVCGPVCPTTQELFVQYNLYDPLLTYIFYGFVDINAPHIYSVPMELTMQNGLKIRLFGSNNIINEDDVPDELKRLKDYIPQISNEHNGSVEVSMLMIPSTNESQLLREVLEVVINTIGNQQPAANNDLHQEVLHLEKQIIVNNMSYWQQVQTLLDDEKSCNKTDSKPAFAQVQQLIDFFKGHCQQYSEKFGIRLF